MKTTSLANAPSLEALRRVLITTQHSAAQGWVHVYPREKQASVYCRTDNHRLES